MNALPQWALRTRHRRNRATFYLSEIRRDAEDNVTAYTVGHISNGLRYFTRKAAERNARDIAGIFGRRSRLVAERLP